MSSVGDWLALHGFDSASLQEMIAAVRTARTRGVVPFDTHLPEDSGFSENPPDISTREAAFATVVVPAFESAFPDVPHVPRMLEQIRFRVEQPEGEGRPYTVDMGEGLAPVVVMEWRPGSPESLVHLAHETAHALQIQLSNHEFMPPVAREVCAFLGELLVMKHVRDREVELFVELVRIWDRDNGSYLGGDLELLREALGNVAGPYDYRFNYPPARLMAVEIFRRDPDGDMLRELFSSGGEAMRFLDIAVVTAVSGGNENPLHPMPEWNGLVPAMNAYRDLGAIVTLDMISGASTAGWSIGEYYGTFSEYLKQQRVHLVLDDARRPAGYAVWETLSSPADGPRLMLERAVYCSREDLRAKVRRHLKERGTGRASACRKGDAVSSDSGREVRIDPYAAAGYAVELLAFSDYHGNFPVGDYLSVEILPPVLRGQAHFHLAKEGIPLAMVTWAWLDSETEKEVLSTGRALEADEWKCGDRLFFNDWIAPFGHSREVMRHLRRNVFPGTSKASGVRRNRDGSVRRVGRCARTVRRGRQRVGSV